MGRAGWTAAVVILIVALSTRNSLIFTMALILGLLGLVVWLWSRYSLSEVSYRRRFDVDHVFFGEKTDLHLEVTNAKPLPLAWLRCEDDIPVALALEPEERARHYLPTRRVLVNLFSLGIYQRVIRRYTVTGTHRGAWRFGPVQLICGDIFGFRSQLLEDPETSLLLVYPRMYTLPELGLEARHPFGDHESRNRLIEDPLRLSGVREYLPGDNFRYIHWKATARRQELQTKLFEPSASRPLAIFVNIRTFQHRFEGVDPELREFAISVGASIARWAQMQGEEFGVFANSMMYAGRRVRVLPSAHPRQLTSVLEALAYCVGIPHTSIERVLQQEADHLRIGTSIVVVSATLSDNLRRVLIDLQRRGFAVTLLGIGELTLERAIPGVAFQKLSEQALSYLTDEAEQEMHDAETPVLAD
ncbi:MAG: DUF58 domain-containing protein [Caldilineaceae bacterium SB0670_bin_27]|uniref:DUF58 domain-containing protein n=1 Tax=Caldilineaceae bacterium SB0664_bin_27 TaxID=2605260 RepID=A0A6B0YTS9_9CHLR|nr:DUF58 domain-containing protein [Caldilineaceae bacterium SB0664_bin_27]MYJ79810.1 DUF58 domain-containing protein [Caldilineaceae bacterium SB0670_bin_27]